MFFVIFSTIWSIIQEVYNRDYSFIFVFLIVWGWLLDMGVYYQRWKILKNIVTWSILSIGVKLVDLNSTIAVISGALLISSIVDRTPLWKNRKKMLISSMQCSAISVIMALIVDIYHKNSVNKDKTIINVNTLPFFLIVNTVIYAHWYYHEKKIKTK